MGAVPWALTLFGTQRGAPCTDLPDRGRRFRPGTGAEVASAAMSDASAEYRIEHDTMGEVRVPMDAKWAAQTQRAVDNFPISGLHIDRALIAALAAIKGAAALSNVKLKTVDKAVGEAIAAA